MSENIAKPRRASLRRESSIHRRSLFVVVYAAQQRIPHQQNPLTGGTPEAAARRAPHPSPVPLNAQFANPTMTSPSIEPAEPATPRADNGAVRAATARQPQ